MGKRAQLVEKRGAKMDKDTRWLINNKLNTEISKLRDETNASVEALALQSKEARAEMKKEMLYAIRSAASVAKQDLAIAIRDSVKKMQAFQKRAAASHASSALARKALASRIASNAKSVSRMIRDAVATDARARLALKAETAKAIKKTNMRVDAYAERMRNQAKAARAEIKALATTTTAKVKAEEARASQALAKFTSKDAARQKAALKFAATQMGTVTSEVKNVETRLVGEIAVVSGEVISNKANQIRVNRRVAAELKRVVRVSDRRYSASKRARGKLKLLMDENKAAASAEVKALSTSLKTKLAKARGCNARNRREMAKDLSQATRTLYERMSNMQKRNEANSAALRGATAAAAMASANALKRAKSQFASKISMLTNVVAANAKRAERDLTRVTGVVHNIAKAAAADRKLIKDQTRAMEADLNKSIVRAIAIGEARAKA